VITLGVADPAVNRCDSCSDAHQMSGQVEDLHGTVRVQLLEGSHGVVVAVPSELRP
jgi:hypothetical protein